MVLEVTIKGCHQWLQITEFPRRTILKYSVIVVIGGKELISSILSEKPTSHSTYPTLPRLVLFAMTTCRGGMKGWQAGARALARHFFYLIIKCDQEL